MDEEEPRCQDKSSYVSFEHNYHKRRLIDNIEAEQMQHIEVNQYYICNFFVPQLQYIRLC